MSRSGRLPRDPGRDARAPVATLRREPRIPEPFHQLDPEVGDRRVRHPGCVGRSEKPYPGIDGTTTSNASCAEPPCANGSASNGMSLSISKTEPGHPWVRMPAASASSRGPRVDAVNPGVADPDQKLRKRIQPSLVDPPVEPALPVRDHATQPCLVDSLAPPHARHRVGPARAGEPLAQIGEHTLRHARTEGLDVSVVPWHADRHGRRPLISKPRGACGSCRRAAWPAAGRPSLTLDGPAGRLQVRVADLHAALAGGRAGLMLVVGVRRRAGPTAHAAVVRVVQRLADRGRAARVGIEASVALLTAHVLTAAGIAGHRRRARWRSVLTGHSP